MAFTTKRRDEERKYNRFTGPNIPFHCSKKLFKLIDKFLATIKVYIPHFVNIFHIL